MTSIQLTKPKHSSVLRIDQKITICVLADRHFRIQSGMQSDTLMMDAVRLAVINLIPPSLLFRYVVSTPLKLSPEASDEFALLVNQPVALQVELGRVGRRHMDHLVNALKQAALENICIDHLRTDGDIVWVPAVTSLP